MKKGLQNLILNKDFSTKLLCLLFSFLLLNTQEVIAQATPCSSPIVYFLSTEGVSSSTSGNDGKIKLYGDVTATHRVVVSTTALAAPTGNTEYTNAPLFSTFTNGYIKTNAPNTTQIYYIRVYSPDGSCYTDKNVNFDKINFYSAPAKPDIEVFVDKSIPNFINKNTAFNVLVSIKNTGTATATGVEVTVTIPAGITLGTPTATVGTYTAINATTGKWSISSLSASSSAVETLTFTNSKSTTEGLKFITANLSAEGQIDLDSSPTTNNLGEDDQGYTCVSTPYEYCNGNTIAITLPSYNGIVWKKGTTTITGTVPGEYILNPDNSLTITSIGDYSYTVNLTGTGCVSGGCCPIRVIAAPLPILSLTPSPVSCFGGNNGSIAASATSGSKPYEFSKNGTAFQATGAFGTLTAGNYTITVKDSLGCIATATTTITQPNVLAVSTTPASPAICFGSSTNLNASASGGTTPYTYAWSPATNLSSTTTANTTASPTTTTLYKVTVTDGNGCTSTATVNVTVNQTPIASAPTVAAICAGNTINLTSANTNAAITTGLSYSWAGPDSFTSTLQNPSITNATVAKGGIYTVTITSATGVCTSTATVNVTVNPMPTATLTAPTICAGQTTTLTPTGLLNAATFSWSTGATTSSIPVNPTVTTLYTLTVSSGAGCSITRSVWVEVNPLPAASIETVNSVCLGMTSRNNGAFILSKYRDTDTYILPLTGVNTYAAIPANGLIASGLANTSTTYTVTIKNSFGCTQVLTPSTAAVACDCPIGYCEPATITKSK